MSATHARESGTQNSPRSDWQTDNAVRRTLIRAWHARGWEAFRARAIPRGAIAYMRFLAQWALDYGDGDAFTLGDRWQAVEARMDRKTIRTYRNALVRCGLVAYSERWAHKRGWFYLAETKLVLENSTGGNFPPVTGGISPPDTGGKNPPSLNRLSKAAPALDPSGVVCPKELGASRKQEGGERQKTASSVIGAGSLDRGLIGNLRKALGNEWENDAGKWVNRVKTQADKVRRCLADLSHALKTGKPVKTRAGYLEDCWKRFR